MHADQCLHAFLWYQTFLHDANELLGKLQHDDSDEERARRIVLRLFHDLRLAPYHGKGPADAAGGLISRFLATAILDEVRDALPAGALCTRTAPASGPACCVTWRAPSCVRGL